MTGAKRGGADGRAAQAPTAALPGEPAAAPSSLRLDDALKYFGIATTGGQAKLLIQDGAVLVNGVVETRRKHRLKAGDQVAVGGVTFVVGSEQP